MNASNKTLIAGGIALLVLVLGIFWFVRETAAPAPGEGSEEEQMATSEDKESDVSSDKEMSEVETENEETETEKAGRSTSPQVFPQYSSVQVSAHKSESDCWTIVRGNVYDVTPAIKTHPGGSEKILNMCGRDATEEFVKQHGGKQKQEMGLEKMQIGVLEK
ncbi:MAG: cytochrome b5 domain-containing protein [Candidatus Moraniibacteriota bacterium]|nr:MAG: cytochrome b5 domain-containing protein [Candidatus Moranbacteria bacterium]